jgi:hypothetical protein
MRNFTFENFPFQQGYHGSDWLSRVKGEMGVVETSFLACLVFEGQSTRLCFSAGEHLELVGQPWGLGVQPGGPFAGS